MHGWSMQAGDFFDCKKGNLVNLLDRMIENKDIQPLIVVSATFDALNQPQNFMRSVAEIQVFNQVNSQMVEMMQSQTFNENNFCYAIRKNGRHNIATCEEYLYHALKIIFKYEK